MLQQDYESQYVDVEEYYGDVRLRWAQIAGRNATIQALEEHVRTILVVMPTGVGKTMTMASFFDHPDLRRALKIPTNRKLKVLFVAHMHRLLTQAERTFLEIEHNIEVIFHTPFTQITPELIADVDIVCLDEAHHEAMASIQYQLDTLIDKPIVGFTATPDRADGMVIKFERIIEPITRQRAVELGWLAETSIWSYIDTSSNDKTDITTRILQQYHHMMGKTIVFLKTRQEVLNIQNLAVSLGRKSVALINQTGKEMDRVLDGFSNNEYDMLINCSKIGEGVDVKGCTSVVLGRQLRSYTMLNQYVGRSARPDSESFVFELINPLKGDNLDTTIVTGTPKQHKLCSWNSINNNFREFDFDYTNTSVVGMVKNAKETIAFRR